MANPASIFDLSALRGEGNRTARFEGKGCDVPVSFFHVDSDPGHAVPLHHHPYAEIWIVQDGAVTFTVDDETFPVMRDCTVVVPANTVHGFRNDGDTPLRMVCIHASEEIITVWSDESSATNDC